MDKIAEELLRCNSRLCDNGNRVVCGDGNSLEAVNPVLARQWHPTKNLRLTARDVRPRSNKRAWWMCGKGHEWQATIDSRSRGNGCPYCSGRLATNENCLQSVNPALAAEWHPTRNGSMAAKAVTPWSNKRVWWMCNRGHEWQATVAGRSRGRGCPYCAGKAVCEDNCLETVHPTLAEEWHRTRNEGLTARDVTPGSDRRAWWRCSRGHEWQATVGSRSGGTGCPFCHPATSALELRILCEMKYLFSDVQHRARVHGEECDVFIPTLQVAIEYDSVYWHKNRLRHDKRKDAALRDRGITLIRVRETGLERISDGDVFVSNSDSEISVVSRVVKRLGEERNLSGSARNSVGVYLEMNRLANDSEYRRLLEMLPSPLPGVSLVEQNPNLASEWHPERNGSLTARDVSSSSNRKVWWLCSKGHAWEATVNQRGRGRGCPYCAGKAACQDNCLQTLNPVLAAEWHPTRNGGLTARSLTPWSNKRIWWTCRSGHEWQATVDSRSRGNGCPYCAGKAVCEDNCLQAINPVLAAQWHPTMNGSLTARGVRPRSSKKAWWMCDRGHEWQATVASRSGGRACPYCVGQAVCEDNCLQTVNPVLASQWHPTRNGSLTARDVRPWSNRSIWWICERGHEWQATVGSRSRGNGCRYCAGKAASEDNCLQTVNPVLATQWHPSRNQSLSAKDVTPWSHKKVWWTCSRGHEWQASIAHRSGGTGCPYCAGQRELLP